MTNSSDTRGSALSNFIFAAGVILAISYPVLALSTGVRAIYQIFEGDPTNSPWLTLIAALCYIVATIGFAKQPRDDDAAQPPKPARTALGRWYRSITPQQAWRISVYVLCFESLLTLIVGLESTLGLGWFGRNVWQYFGRDYGYFPLVQPLLGIAWLFHPNTLRRYGIGRRKREA